MDYLDLDLIEHYFERYILIQNHLEEQIAYVTPLLQLWKGNYYEKYQEAPESEEIAESKDEEKLSDEELNSEESEKSNSQEILKNPSEEK